MFVYQFRIFICGASKLETSINFLFLISKIFFKSLKFSQLACYSLLVNNMFNHFVIMGRGHSNSQPLRPLAPATLRVPRHPWKARPAK